MTITDAILEFDSLDSIGQEHVSLMRRCVYGKEAVMPHEVDFLFRMNDRIGPDAHPDWAAFFVEALTDYVVHQAEPYGYVSEQNADWLMQRISHAGRVDAATELELLVKILERAQSSPVRLVGFALEQVKHGVVHGEGPVGRSRRLKKGVIGEAEVELLRRILYAFGGDGHIAVTQQEAAILFDINDMTAEADNHPSWSDLFCKAIANFLLYASGYEVPTRQEALRRETWLDAPTDGIGGFMSRMLVDGLHDLFSAYGTPEEDDAPPAVVELPHVKSISDAELAWIMGRIGRSGRLHQNELALINFLKVEHAPLPRRLMPLLDKVAA